MLAFSPAGPGLLHLCYVMEDRSAPRGSPQIALVEGSRLSLLRKGGIGFMRV